MCAHAVRVAVKKIEGVESVDVSLNGGLAVIRLEPENRVTVGRLRDVIRKNGFTPKEARVAVAGTPVAHEGRPALRVPDQGAPFLLVDGPGAAGRVDELARVGPGQVIVVEGHIPETAGDASGPLTLHVSAFEVRRPE